MSGKRDLVFLREVAQMPDALAALTAFYRSDGSALLENAAAWIKEAGRVVFTGMGTSEFAPLLIVQALAAHGVDATTVDSGEWLHYDGPKSARLVAVSQSGESVEPRKIVERCEDRARIGAIVNNPNSTIARRASWVLSMCAGDEAAISTKTYMNTMAVLYLLAKSFDGPKSVNDALDTLDRLADAVMRVNLSAEINQAASRIADTGWIHFVARGPAMVAARQAALTFMEGAHVSAQALTGGAFRHGPYELADAGHRCVLFIPGGATCELMTAMASELANLDSRVVVITDQALALTSAQCVMLKVPDFGEMLFPLAAAMAQSLLLDAVGRARGVETGVFRYGGKITSRE